MCIRDRYGMRHTIPISTNFKLLKHLSVSMSGNYEEVWTGSTLQRSDYDPETESSGEKIEIKGFDRFGQYNFGMGIGTTVYGLFNFKKESKIEAIRHVIRPSINYSIRPSFDEYYDTYIIDANGNTAEYTRFEENFFGSPSKTYSSSIGLQISNNLEAKVRSKDSLASEPKKITILNNLNLSTSYNLAADSLKLSPVRMTGGTNLFNNKLNINLGATFDPYQINELGARIDKLNIKNGKLFRMTSANINMSFSIDSKSLGEGSNKDNVENLTGGGRADDLFGSSDDLSRSTFDNEDLNDEKNENTAEYNNKIPVSYTHLTLPTKA